MSSLHNLDPQSRPSILIRFPARIKRLRLPTPEAVIATPSLAAVPVDWTPMTRADAAAFLGRDPDTLSRWTAAGTVPHGTVGGKPVYYRPQLHAYTLGLPIPTPPGCEAA